MRFNSIGECIKSRTDCERRKGIEKEIGERFLLYFNLVAVRRRQEVSLVFYIYAVNEDNERKECSREVVKKELFDMQYGY